METKHYKSSYGGSFELEDNGKMIAEITYKQVDSNCIMVDHTFVDNAWRGQDLGKKLVAAVADFARRENLKVIPMCSYARAVMGRTPDYCDILK